jgi:CBS domain-containing protein
VIGSAVVYGGLVLALGGLVLAIKPVRRLRFRTRRRGLAVVGAGVGLATLGALLPAPTARANRPRTRLDELMPAWQFRELHSRTVAAPPERVYDAINAVRADEIRLFQALTWIRRGGRRLPESILNAGDSTPIIDVATRTSFVRLADDVPRELVLGTIVAAPPGMHRHATADDFRKPVAPGHALAAMNFLVRPTPSGGSIVSTETRVFANSDAARRRFAVYWRVIYPGSALIRRMWLRAIQRRVETED